MLLTVILRWRAELASASDRAVQRSPPRALIPAPEVSGGEPSEVLDRDLGGASWARARSRL